MGSGLGHLSSGLDQTLGLVFSTMPTKEKRQETPWVKSTSLEQKLGGIQSANLYLALIQSIFFSFRFFFHFMCLSVLSGLYMCTTCVPGQRGQKRMSVPQQLETEGCEPPCGRWETTHSQCRCAHALSAVLSPHPICFSWDGIMCSLGWPVTDCPA